MELKDINNNKNIEEVKSEMSNFQFMKIVGNAKNMKKKIIKTIGYIKNMKNHIETPLLK